MPSPPSETCLGNGCGIREGDASLSALHLIIYREKSPRLSRHHAGRLRRRAPEARFFRAAPDSRPIAPATFRNVRTVLVVRNQGVAGLAHSLSRHPRRSTGRRRSTIRSLPSTGMRTSNFVSFAVRPLRMPCQAVYYVQSGRLCDCQRELPWEIRRFRVAVAFFAANSPASARLSWGRERPARRYHALDVRL